MTGCYLGGQGCRCRCRKSAGVAGWRVAGGLQHGGKVLANHERDRRVTDESRRLDAAGDHQGQHSPGTVIGQAEQHSDTAMMFIPCLP